MIISFSIRNFGSIKDKVTLSFEPGKSSQLDHYYLIEPAPGLKLLKLGIIYGSNGSGKTTILKALDFLRNLVTRPMLQKNATLEFHPFLFDDKTPGETSGFELQFVHNATRYKYEIEFTREAILCETLHFYAPHKALVFERTTDQEKPTFQHKIRRKNQSKKSL